jgi:hypothetical protein
VERGARRGRTAAAVVARGRRHVWICESVRATDDLRGIPGAHGPAPLAFSGLWSVRVAVPGRSSSTGACRSARRRCPARRRLPRRMWQRRLPIGRDRSVRGRACIPARVA